ncbi:DUF2332 family protein [Planktomarina sp.]|uniref:DUF2332 family protein n=1 Tax=Planktomarina sp. TaxID=2024851 RepID=UPI0028902D2F|nr:DUF2332 family protein [Planktomarina sp.]
MIPAPEADNLPLRLVGGMHALLLSEKVRELVPIYLSRAIADADMPTRLQAVLQRHDAEPTAFIANDLQTNEVWRAARFIAAAHSLKAYNGSDFIASKLGASTSLNLVCNRFHLPLVNGYGP